MTHTHLHKQTHMTNVEKIQIGNINQLNQLLTTITGYPIHVESINVSHDGYVSFISNSLIEHTGIMKNFYNSFNLIGNNSSRIEANKTKFCGVMIDFSFSYHSGGSNGINITTIFYDFECNVWSNHNFL
jgi:hypothetical protein